MEAPYNANSIGIILDRLRRLRDGECDTTNIQHITSPFVQQTGNHDLCIPQATHIQHNSLKQSLFLPQHPYSPQPRRLCSVEEDDELATPIDFSSTATGIKQADTTEKKTAWSPHDSAFSDCSSASRPSSVSPAKPLPVEGISSTSNITAIPQVSEVPQTLFSHMTASVATSNPVKDCLDRLASYAGHQVSPVTMLVPNLNYPFSLQPTQMNVNNSHLVSPHEELRKLNGESRDRFSLYVKDVMKEIDMSNKHREKKVVKRKTCSQQQDPPNADPQVPATSPAAIRSAKDMAYWERRRRNNEAAKRSRDIRKIKENEIAVRADFLSKENEKLKVDLSNYRAELSQLRHDLARVNAAEAHRMFPVNSTN